MSVQTGRRSFEDVQIAYANYNPLWMEFVAKCPELLETPWFYEGYGITEETAIQLRRMVAVWVMLFGTDIVKDLIPRVDADMAIKCHNSLLVDNANPDTDMCTFTYMMILAQLRYHNQEAFLSLIDDLHARRIPGFDEALMRIQP